MITTEQKQKLIQLTSKIEITCIAWGKADYEHQRANSPEGVIGTKNWLDRMNENWRVASNDLYAFIDSLEQK